MLSEELIDNFSKDFKRSNCWEKFRQWRTTSGSFRNKDSIINWTRGYYYITLAKENIKFSFHHHNFTRTILKSNRLRHLAKGISRHWSVHVVKMLLHTEFNEVCNESAEHEDIQNVCLTNKNSRILLTLYGKVIYKVFWAQ